MSTEPLHAQGATFTWGTTSFQITSFSLESSLESQDIDITSMSSAVKDDPSNTGRKLVARDFDSCFSAQGGLEVKVDILLDSSIGNPWNCIGEKRPLSVKVGTGTGALSPANLYWDQDAILTNFSGGAPTGDFLKGSATFRLTD